MYQCRGLKREPCTASRFIRKTRVREFAKFLVHERKYLGACLGITRARRIEQSRDIRGGRGLFRWNGHVASSMVARPTRRRRITYRRAPYLFLRPPFRHAQCTDKQSATFRCFGYLIREVAVKFLFYAYPILVGVLGAPVVALLTIVVAYLILACVMPENEGRRGLLAGVLGLPIGTALGFIAGYSIACYLRDMPTSSHTGLAGFRAATLAGLAMGVPAGLIAAAVGLIVGTHLAEARGVTNYAGERAAWGLFYVALPAGVLTAAVGFIVGREIVC